MNVRTLLRFQPHSHIPTIIPTILNPAIPHPHPNPANTIPRPRTLIIPTMPILIVMRPRMIQTIKTRPPAWAAPS